MAAIRTARELWKVIAPWWAVVVLLLFYVGSGPSDQPTKPHPQNTEPRFQSQTVQGLLRGYG